MSSLEDWPTAKSNGGSTLVSGGFGGISRTLNTQRPADEIASGTNDFGCSPERSKKRNPMRATVETVPSVVTGSGRCCSVTAGGPRGRPVSPLLGAHPQDPTRPKAGAGAGPHPPRG